MLVNAIVLGLIGIFLVYCIWDACRKFIGRNPNAPGFVARLRAWWPGFVTRHIVDNDPFAHEGHSKTRYRRCANCCESDDNGNPASCVCDQCLADDAIEPMR